LAALFDEAFLRKLERLALLTRRAAVGQMQGERRSARRGQSVEFADFRPYVLGDDFRRIDWNAYARLERFFIKLFVEEKDLTVHFLIDASRSMDWGEPNKLAYGLRAAGAIGYVALLGLDRITATALGLPRRANGNASVVLERFPPARNKASVIPYFSFLEALLPNPNAPVLTGASAPADLRRYAANAGSPGPLLLFSDLMDDNWKEPLTSLAGRGFEIGLVHILSPDEIEPELSGEFRLIDSETAAQVEITADFETTGRYRAFLAAWREDWRVFCAKRSIHYLPIDTRLPLDELLFARMRQQGVLR
jgi:uncharacterized protein (DUF58 family)